MSTSTRVYWHTNRDGIDGWEAQRNDGTVVSLGGYKYDSDSEVRQHMASLSPGLDFGTVTIERDW